MKYAWITRHRDSFPVRVMCDAMNVSTSGYYDAIERPPSGWACPSVGRAGLLVSVVRANGIGRWMTKRRSDWSRRCWPSWDNILGMAIDASGHC